MKMTVEHTVVPRRCLSANEHTYDECQRAGRASRRCNWGVLKTENAG